MIAVPIYRAGAVHPSPPAPLPHGERGALLAVTAPSFPSPLEGEGGPAKPGRMRGVLLTHHNKGCWKGRRHDNA